AAGVFFGRIAGWIIGSELAENAPRPRKIQSDAAPQAAAPAQETNAPAPAILDETKVQALQAVVARDAKNAAARGQLGDLYYDAGRYPDAIKWYEESLALNPKDVNVSTDLGVSYFYNKDSDRTIEPDKPS